MTKDVLFLGSQSTSRQNLLKSAKIPFTILSHNSNEQVDREDLSFCNYVKLIAEEKMESLTLPDLKTCEKTYIFVLTADTLVHDMSNNKILSKPRDLEDAKSILRCMQNKKVEVVTGCCIQKLEKNKNNWDLVARESWTTGALVEFWVDDTDFDTYFHNVPGALCASGAAIIEDYGQVFLKSINGSYSSVMGLPIFELVKNLKKLNFKF